MSHSNPVKFPGQELEKSLDKIQGILDTAKSLAIQLVSYEKIKWAIANYIEAVQVFLSEEKDAAENYQKDVEKKGKQNHSNNLARQRRIAELEELKEKGSITLAEEEELTDKKKEQKGS